jgi:hypothetical protein
MSFKALSERTHSRSVSKVCPICGRTFYAHSHQRMCKRCKQMHGKSLGFRRFKGRV